MLDVTGPLEVFSMANSCLRSAGKAAAYDVVLAAPAIGPLATTSGVSLLATASLHDQSLCADTLLVAGGPGARLAHESATVSALTGLCRRSGRVGSICTGLFLPRRARRA